MLWCIKWFVYKMSIILSQSSPFHTPSIQPRLIAVKNTFKQKKPKECWSRLEWRINAANGYYKEHMYICLWYSNLLKLKECRRMVHQKHSQSPFYRKYTRFNGLSFSCVVCIYMKYSPIIIIEIHRRYLCPTLSFELSYRILKNSVEFTKVSRFWWSSRINKGLPTSVLVSNLNISTAVCIIVKQSRKMYKLGVVLMIACLTTSSTEECIVKNLWERRHEIPIVAMWTLH